MAENSSCLSLNSSANASNLDIPTILSPLQKHVRKVVGGFGKKSCLQERFERIRKEYKKGKRKLEKLQRKSKAKAHVQQKLREQADLVAGLNHGYVERPTNNLPDSRTSGFELRNENILGCHPISIKTTASDHNIDQVVPEILSLKNDKMKKCLDNNMLYENADKGNSYSLKENKLKSDTGKSVLSTSGKQKLPRMLCLTKYKNRNHVVKLYRKSAPQYEVSPMYCSLVDETSNIKQNDMEMVSKPSQRCMEVSPICSNSVDWASNIGKHDKEIVNKTTLQCVDESPSCSSLVDDASNIGKRDKEIVNKTTLQCVDESPSCSSLVDDASNIEKHNKEIVNKTTPQCVDELPSCSSLVDEASNIGKNDKEIVNKSTPQCVDELPSCSSLVDQASNIKKHNKEIINSATLHCVDESPSCSSLVDQASDIGKNQEVVNEPSRQCLEISPLCSNLVDLASSLIKNDLDIVNGLPESKLDMHNLTRNPCALETVPEVHISKTITVDHDSHIDHSVDSEVNLLKKRNFCDRFKKLNRRLSLTRNVSVVDRSDRNRLDENIEAPATVNPRLDTSSPGNLSKSSIIPESDNSVEVKRSLSRAKRRSLTGIRRLSPRVSSLHDSKESYLMINNENGLISSMFQCLIDESKRNKNIKDFELGTEFSIKIGLSKCDNILSTDCTQTKSERENSDSENYCDGTSTTATLKVDPKMRATDHVKITDRSNGLQSSSGTCNFWSGSIRKEQLECLDTNHVKESVLEICDEKYSGNVFTNINTPSNEMKQSQIENSSPTLFESPNNSLDRSNATSADTGRDCAFLQELYNENLKTTDAADGIILADKETGRATYLQEEISLGSNVFLEQKALLEIPRTEVVLSVVTAEISLSNKTEVYIVCLCTQSLRFYGCSDLNDWCNILNYTLQPEAQMKKNSAGRLHALSIDGCLGVVAQVPKTTSTYLHLYMYRNSTVEHVQLDSISGRSVNVKCLSEGNFLMSCYTSPSSSIMKYTYNSKILKTQKIPTSATPTSRDWEKLSLDKVSGQITCLILVQSLPSALLGLTLSRKLHIWNHQHGMILCTIDVSDVCPKDVVCPAAFSEQGYLFLPVLSRKKDQEVGSVIVVNPMLSTCETLLPLAQPKHIWKGCNWARILLDNFLCTRQTTGEICIWSVHDGCVSAVLDTILSSCFTSQNDRMVLVNDNILSVYKCRTKVESCR